MSSHRVKLTKSFIDQLELTPAIYRDSELIGFAVRVNTSYKTYIVEKKVNGKSTRSTIGLHHNMTLDQAREIAQEKLVQLSLGININAKKRKLDINETVKTTHLRSKPTLADAFAVYIKYKALKERTLSDYKIVINKYLTDWCDYKIDEISRTMVQIKHTELSQKSKAQANMAMRVFRAIYNFSVEHYLDEKNKPILEINNPVRTLNHKSAWNHIYRRNNYLNKDQLPHWIHAVFHYQDRGQQQHTNRDFLLTLILTGFRREACESLTWSHIDLKDGFITSIDPQTNEPHTLPMGDFLFDLMKQRKKMAVNEWVFPSAKSQSGHIINISKVRQKINDRCGISFTFHDLRRTFRSIAENLDHGHHTIKRLLTHTKADNHNQTIVDHQHDKKLREAMNTIEDILLKQYKINNHDG